MRRLLVLLAVLTVVVSGCGDDAGGSGTASGSDASSTGGDGDTATAPDDICAAVPAADVGSAAGLTFTGEDTPGGGCSYDQEDPRETSVSISTVPTTSDNGGFEGSVVGAKAVLTDAQETPVSGVGDQAIIVSGTFTGMSSELTTGLVDLGGFTAIVQVLGGDTATHAELTESVMKLAADKLG